MALSKKDTQVSLNIKVPEAIDLRLKAARQAARAKGLVYNVSDSVTKFLEKELKKVERELGIIPLDPENMDMFEDQKPEKATKKANKKDTVTAIK